MATKKEIEAERKKMAEKQKKLKDAALELVIKRSKVSKKAIIEGAYRRFFINNIDLLTPAEREKFKSVILW